MANMRDKIVALRGKKLHVGEAGEYGIVIAPQPERSPGYQTISEVGEDYFIVEWVWIRQPTGEANKPPTIYAISAITKIEGSII